MTFQAFFLICAFICFVLATVGIKRPRIDFGWAGLALLALSWLFTANIFPLR